MTFYSSSSLFIIIATPALTNDKLLIVSPANAEYCRSSLHKIRIVLVLCAVVMRFLEPIQPNAIYDCFQSSYDPFRSMDNLGLPQVLMIDPFSPSSTINEKYPVVGLRIPPLPLFQLLLPCRLH